jgi:hypothetical protein
MIYTGRNMARHRYKKMSDYYRSYSSEATFDFDDMVVRVYYYTDTPRTNPELNQPAVIIEDIEVIEPKNHEHVFTEDEYRKIQGICEDFIEDDKLPV